MQADEPPQQIGDEYQDVLQNSGGHEAHRRQQQAEHEHAAEADGRNAFEDQCGLMQPCARSTKAGLDQHAAGKLPGEAAQVGDERQGDRAAVDGTEVREQPSHCRKQQRQGGHPLMPGVGSGADPHEINPRHGGILKGIIRIGKSMAHDNHECNLLIFALSRPGPADENGIERFAAVRNVRSINQNPRRLNMWTKPEVTEMRFGFEVTMYVCNR